MGLCRLLLGFGLWSRSNSFTDCFLINPSPDHDIGTCYAVGDYGFMVVVKFIIAANVNVLCIHFVETAAICFASDFFCEFQMAGCDKSVMHGFGIIGIEKDWRKMIGISHEE